MTFKDRVLSIPYYPVAGWIAVIGWQHLGRGGITPLGHFYHVLPHWLVFAWTLAFAVGGTLAVFGACTGRTRTESSGLAFVLTGLVFYGIFVSWATGDIWNTALVTIALTAMSAIRLRVLALARRGQKLAAQIRIRE